LEGIRKQVETQNATENWLNIKEAIFEVAAEKKKSCIETD
jgi:hypothetical protein